ncbi:MAG: sulfatase-like hydrolase/transferase [Planctomycetaceae bacterium]
MFRQRIPAMWLAILACLATFLFDSAAAADPPRRPNIVFLFTDDLGYADIGCYGNDEVKTPHLDRLASQGVRFTDFSMSSSICGPSRSALITGRYPQRNGVYDNIRNDRVNHGFRYDAYEYSISPEMTLGLDVREITFGDAVKAAGYRTGVVGKWDMGQARRFLPLQRGFDFFYGHGNNGIDYWTHRRYEVESLFRGNERIEDEGYATNLFGREGERFIRENKDRPFFLYLSFNAPHGPSNFDRTGPQAPDEALALYPDRDPKEAKTRYLANISSMDANVGRVLAALDELELAENTVVFFSSDHGATRIGNNGPFRGVKGQFFEGGIRVPLIVRWPGRVEPGSTIDDWYASLDLFPTFVSIAGGELPEGVKYDGFDMTPRLLNETDSSPRREMVWGLQNERAVRVGSIKWVRAPRFEGLFDLAEDPGEQNDLVEAKPDLLAKMHVRWDEWKKEMEDSEPRGPFRDY